MCEQPLSLRLIFRNCFTLNTEIRNYDTRGANKIHVTKARITTRKITLRHGGTSLLNSFDKSITQSKSLFQNNLKSLLFTQLYIRTSLSITELLNKTCTVCTHIIFN